MRDSEIEKRTEEQDDGQPERRGFTWAALVALLVVTLLAAVVIAYLITMHNFPAR